VLGELAASLAHEVRNPLTGVRSLAQRLAEEEVSDEKRRKYAGVILEESARVERLVANLLGIARRGQKTEGRSRTELAPLFEDLSLLTQGRAERTQVRIAVSAGKTSADAPREPLAQALLNLLLNAVNHSPPGGVVTLAAKDTPGGVMLSVSDQGPGVPVSERERIWEAFHTSGAGTGLGLAVVRRLAEDGGWTLQVGTAAGGGAEFTIFIPSASDAVTTS
jgi:two-component system, NtrC family, sensor histidine kinase HydH